MTSDSWTPASGDPLQRWLLPSITSPIAAQRGAFSTLCTRTTAAGPPLLRGLRDWATQPFWQLPSPLPTAADDRAGTPGPASVLHRIDGHQADASVHSTMDVPSWGKTIHPDY